MPRGVSYGSSSSEHRDKRQRTPERQRFSTGIDRQHDGFEKQRVSALREVELGETSDLSEDGLNEVYRAREAVAEALEDEQFQRSTRYRRTHRAMTQDPDEPLFTPANLPLTNKPVPSRLLTSLRKAFGKEVPNAYCFGCSRGIGLVPQTTVELQRLEMLIIEQTSALWGKPIQVVENVYDYYNALRAKNNNNVKEDYQLPAWSHWSIYEHIYKTMPSPVPSQTIATIILKEHIDVLLEGNVYQTPVYCAENGIERTVVNPEGHKMLLQSLTLLSKYERSGRSVPRKYDPSSKVSQRAIVAKVNTLSNLQTGIGSARGEAQMF